MAWHRTSGNNGGKLEVLTASGDIASFETNLVAPYQSVTVNIEATGGNGTPDNPNPISGYTEANITANGNTYAIPFGQTVYGGVLDVTRGKLHVDKAYKDLGTLNYTMYLVAQGNLFRSDEFDIKRVTSTTEVPDIISSIFVAVASANRANYTISMTNNTARIDIIDGDYSDAVVFKSAMSGVQMVYPLDTPFDIDLTPEVISAVVGTNNVFADCGQTTVKYLKRE